MMSSRLIMAYIIAVAAGMIISKIPIDKILNNRILRGAVRAEAEREGDGAHGHSHAAPDSIPGKLKAAMRTAMRDFPTSPSTSSSASPSPPSSSSRRGGN